MDSPLHSMTSLFDQLGLASTPAAIQAFIATHRPLAGGIALHHASFWSATQAAFLREAVEDDADWAGVIDKLDSALRRTHD